MGDVVLQNLRSGLPEVWKYEDTASVAPVALSEDVAAVLERLERGLDMTEVRTRPAAIEFACRLAEPSAKPIRDYRLVHTGLLDQLYKETARVAWSQELSNATALTLSTMASELADRTAERAVGPTRGNTTADCSGD